MSVALLTQERAPLYEALIRHKNARVVQFDVPGHKKGVGNPALTDFLGKQCVSVDVNSARPLDNLCHPTSCIRDAEQLAAEAFGASAAFFSVGGTTAAVQTMILSCVKEGEKIIMPRNVHRSAINALILSGAVPVYVNPGISERLGIPLGMSAASVRRAIEEHPEAKAVFVNNPTYYGICSCLRDIVALAHAHGMKVLCDEAHGTHFYFGDNLPVSAMAAGADMAAISVHKTGGSLTQSSLLVINHAEDAAYVKQIMNLTQTTSGSYLLMASLDISRRNLAIHGKETFAKVVGLAEYARAELANVGGYYAFSRDIVNGDDIGDYDVTKLSVNTTEIGLAGIEVHDILRDEYDIQVEIGDLGNLMAIVSVGDTRFAIERLVSSMAEIKRLYTRAKSQIIRQEYIAPKVELTPKAAFYAKKEAVAFDKTVGRVSGESIMCYPPGIPILAPGELITRPILDTISYSKAKGCFVMGMLDESLSTLQVMED